MDFDLGTILQCHSPSTFHTQLLCLQRQTVTIRSRNPRH